MLWFVGAFLLVTLAGIAHAFFWSARFRLAMPYALVERIPTSDHAAIELRRLSNSVVTSGSPPVLLVHGIASNHRALDLDEEHSLARYLAARGLDVWLVTLRSGLPKIPPALVRLDALRRIDLPLAVAHVLRTTGAKSLDIVGFSLGGFLAASSLEHGVAQASVRRLVCLAAPTVVSKNAFFWLQARLLYTPVSALPLRALGLLALPWVHWVPTPVHRLIYNAKNMDGRAMNRALANVVQNVGTLLVRDLFAALQAAGFEEQRMRARALNVPVLFITGALDLITDRQGTAALCEAWGADTGCFKSWLSLGPTGNAPSDFGHGDLVLGRNAGRLVFEPIFQFLRS